MKKRNAKGVIEMPRLGLRAALWRWAGEKLGVRSIALRGWEAIDAVKFARSLLLDYGQGGAAGGG